MTDERIRTLVREEVNAAFESRKVHERLSKLTSKVDKMEQALVDIAKSSDKISKAMELLAAGTEKFRHIDSALQANHTAHTEMRQNAEECEEDVRKDINGLDNKLTEKINEVRDVVLLEHKPAIAWVASTRSALRYILVALILTIILGASGFMMKLYAEHLMKSQLPPQVQLQAPPKGGAKP